MIYEIKYLVEKTVQFDLPNIEQAKGVVSQLLKAEGAVQNVTAAKPLSIIPMPPPQQPQQGQVA